MAASARIRALLAPPKFSDEDETRIAASVHRTGLAFLLITVGAAALVAFTLPRPIPRLIVAAGLIAIVGVCLVLVRFGFVLSSARLLVAGAWASIAASLALGPDVWIVSHSAQVLVIAVAGSLLGRGSAYTVAALSALVGPLFATLGLTAGESADVREIVPPVMWIVQAAIFFGAAAVVWIAIRQAEHSRAQARLNEARFRAIADNAPDMIAELDDGGVFVYANQRALAALRLFALDGSGLERMGIPMHPEDRPTVTERFREVAAGGGVRQVAYRMIEETGSVSWLESIAARYLDAEGRVRVVVVTRDVTGQRETEAALRESEERYRLLVEEGPDMIFEFEASGRAVYANPRALESLGLDLAEFCSLEPGERSHPEDFEPCMRALGAVIADGGPSRLVYRMRRRDRTYVWVAAHGSRYFTARGEARVIVQTRDLTEELSLQEQLRESQKMDAIGRLAGGVAHDFNNLLTVIGGYASVIEGSPAPGEAASAAHEILEATDRAAALTRQLLMLSRRQLSQPGIVDLNAAIRGLEPILRRTLPERLSLELELDPELAAIDINPSHLDQVMLNLALNARDAMPGQGTLRIETCRSQAGRFVHLRVSDTGLGMDEATRARAFEPFFTTKSPGAGTGLGLSTTYGIVRQSRGTITLESAPGQGTSVEIVLPASVSRAEPAPRAAGASLAPIIGREAAILLVEDEVSVRRLLATMLESAGYHVTPAADAASALQIASGAEREFDLLISDYVMPGQSGLELCNALRERWPDLAVVLMTGYAEIPGSETVGLPHGAELLTKPFTRDQLHQVVTRLLDGG